MKGILMIVYVAAACGGFLVVALLASDWETAAAMIFDLLCAFLFIGAMIAGLVAVPQVVLRYRKSGQRSQVVDR